VKLRSALWRLGLRYRLDASDLPGRPDIVFRREKVVVFCDGDFWHGRELEARLARLARGHNAPYWVAKIQTNTARDRRNDEALRADGWLVLRYWESDVLRESDAIATTVLRAVVARRASLAQS
jgi:DNA mismatch endonuclease (patch repair protein)